MTGAARTDRVHVTVEPARPAAVVVGTLRPAELPHWLGAAFEAVAGLLARDGLAPAGPPFATFEPRGDGAFAVRAGFPAPAAVAGGAGVEPDELPGGPAASVVHEGPYDALGPVHAELAEWVRGHGGEPAGPAREEYLSEPDAARPLTRVVQPYRPA